MVAGYRIAAMWNEKAAKWVKGRQQFNKKEVTFQEKTSFRIWFHVASLGEFEQARPVMERLKALRPETEIVLTFFSPSGYEIRKEYRQATFVSYLPADTRGHAIRWLEMVKPDMAVFVKYDLWPGYLSALDKMKIPAILMSAYWIPGERWTSWNLPIVKPFLRRFKKIFLQQSTDIAYFNNLGFDNIEKSGDTRIDRVIQLPGEAERILPTVLKGAGQFDLIAGSTWPADEKLLTEAITQLSLRAIIAPHDISPANVKRLIACLPFPAATLSAWESDRGDVSVIVVDRIGLLPYLYAIGKVAYIGGGFGAGIHNTLEPMAHGRPVIFGPKYTRFPEAVAMVKLSGAWSVNQSSDLINRLQNLLLVDDEAENAGKVCSHYLQQYAGSSDQITRFILEQI